jgi:broad specificity phosphatase PhoE
MITPRLWLVRHGETRWSREMRHTSVTDLPLTSAGEHQAQAAAELLAGREFAQVLTSPRLRARRTAELLGHGDATVDPDLVEWAYGDYEGLTSVTIHETAPGWTIWTGPTPGGESSAEIAARLDRVVERVRATDGATLIVGHGHALRVLTARWLGLEPSAGRLFHLDTATVSALGDDRGQAVVVSWNVPGGSPIA